MKRSAIDSDLPETPDPDRDLARQSNETLASFLAGEKTVRLTLTRTNGESLQADLPVKEVSRLVEVLRAIGKGQEVRVYPLDAEVTPNEAAELMRVSRPHLIKLLEEGRIPYRKVGTHHRIRLEDLETYREREREARKRILAELTAESERLGLYG